MKNIHYWLIGLGCVVTILFIVGAFMGRFEWWSALIGINCIIIGASYILRERRKPK